MRTPKRRGSAIDDARIRNWANRFRFYRASPDEDAIRKWLNRFGAAHKDLAARVLDVVEVVSEQEIHDGYRLTLAQVPGWQTDAAARAGRWFFVGFGRAGESGAAMARLFREANNLTEGRYDTLFRSVVELPAMALTAEDTVVFVDDFSGTGRQVCKTWPVLEELVASECRCYLLLTAATTLAIAEISRCTRLELLVDKILGPDDNILSPECHHFTAAEKEVVVAYGEIADRKNPSGYGHCGLVFVLSHKTPNNTIPLLHANHPKWKGLFPRRLGAA